MSPAMPDLRHARDGPIHPWMRCTTHSIRNGLQVRVGKGIKRPLVGVGVETTITMTTTTIKTIAIPTIEAIATTTIATTTTLLDGAKEAITCLMVGPLAPAASRLLLLLSRTVVRVTAHRGGKSSTNRVLEPTEVLL